MFSPSGDLYYLGTSEAHTHKAGMVLRAVSWPVGPEGPSVRAVVPTVPLPEKGAFPGLYPATSPVRGCWRAGKGVRVCACVVGQCACVMGLWGVYASVSVVFQKFVKLYGLLGLRVRLCVSAS